jgi:DNA-binding transcriptional LysR family regulator
VDLAITGRFPEELSVDGRPFAPNEFVLITAPGDPLAAQHGVAVEELAQRTWILREPGSGTRRLCEEYLATQGLRPEVLTMGSNGAIKQAVALGLGIALQSRYAVKLELELGMLAAIHPRGGLPQRAWYVVHSAVGPLRPEVSAFMEFTQSQAAARALARSPVPGA